MAKKNIFTIKPWFMSSTIWINSIGLLIIILEIITKANLIADPDILAIILAGVNIFNRFRTNAPIK